ncbi:Ribonuclease H [Citrus sinensis]|nr:Ribonuclease H [Citrus sinensis]
MSYGASEGAGRGQTTGRFGGERGNAPLRGEFHRERERSPARQTCDADDGVVNAEETELRQHLQDVEQERDQVAARDPGRAGQLEEEVRRLAQIIDDMQGKNRAPGWRIMLDGESPLSAEIMRAVIPRDFRLPDLRYAGRTDPLMHIERFNDMTGVQGLSQSQRCRVFPLSLEGRAREWYRKLPRGSVKTFEQMCQEFAEQFSGAMSPEDDMMELKSMKQGEQETLREFIKRFHRAVLDLRAFNHPQALRGLKEGVKIGRLWYNLRSPAIQTYAAAYEQAKRDIEIEEEKAARIKTDQLEGLGRREMKALPGNGPIRRRDHQASDEGEQSDRILRHEQPAVRVIAGGPTLAGDSNRSRKNYARYAMTSKEVLLNTPAAKRARVRQVPIMWTDEDEEGILYPYEDALVIKATVASKKFDRILVDTGSSVDVLFKSTLEEMGIADRKLEHTNTSLKGFGGGKLVPLGVVELPITIGSPPTERTMILDFVVVEEEGPYQMILGRPFLRMSKAVLSNHYLALKYRVNGVVGVVRGDQRIARSCYSSAAREAMQITSLDTRVENKTGRQEPVEDLETLYLYLAVSDRAASSILVREEEGVQYPIYYTSKALLDAETRYPPLEKWALALVVAARKLRPYFQAFPVSVITNQPLRQTLHKPDASGRLVKWAVELSEFDIDYKPRAAIKAQAMADFVAEFTEPETCLGQQDAVIGNDETQVWQMSVDGSSGERGSGAGIVLEGPEGEEISYAVKLEFAATNNQAEYEALIAGLELARAVKADRVKIRTDSQLVANHVSERFQPREEKMEQYLKIVRQMMGKFEAVEVVQIPREQNSRADILARMAAVADPKMPKSVPLEMKSTPSIEQNLGVLRIEQKCSWRDPIVSYLRDGVLPPHKLRARKIRAQASRYTMIDGVLYRRGYTLPFLRCLDDDDADYVLREVHEGICGNHSGGRSLAHKVLRQGYFWPIMHQDAQKKTRGCASCQSFASFSNQPPEKLTSMASPWPFAQWGIDLIGPLPKGRGAATHAIVAIDYFTKWIEVEALSRITEKKTTDFVWRNLVCRYGIPYALVTDNGRQFNNHSFRDFCQNLGIELKYCSPAHPQSNGQVEAANKTIKRLLKTRLGAKKGAWVDELSGVLWAYRTTHKTATGETPFALAFGHEAVVPAEIGTTTHRTYHFNEQENDEQICLNLDLLTEKREQAAERSVTYQQRVARYYNQKVNIRQFRVGDWVLRRVNQSTKDSTQGVLGPNWEGPYRVKQIAGPGAYRLVRADGHEVKRPWNAAHLRKYFQ